MLSHMFIFYFCYLGFDVKSKKIIAKTDFKELTTSVVLQEFYGFRSLVYFKLIFFVV